MKNHHTSAIKGILLFLIMVNFVVTAGCDKDKENNDAGCDPVGQVTDNTGMYTVTYEELINSSTTPYFRIEYHPTPTITTYNFIRETNGICLDGAITTTESAWIYLPPSNLIVSGNRSGVYLMDYSFTMSGAGANVVHYLGSDQEEKSSESSFSQRLIIQFPYRGTDVLDARYVIDSLKLKVQFFNTYYKAKNP